MAEGKPAVLIVDDQPNWRSLFSDLLEDEYEVVGVGSYEEALRALERDPPFRVAVVDIRLDDKDSGNEDGLRLIERINAERGAPKTIVVTGYPTLRTTRIAFRELGVFDYIEKYPESGKGFDPVGFRKTVRDAIEESCEAMPPSDNAMPEIAEPARDESQEARPDTARSKRWLLPLRRRKKAQVVRAAWAS